jgi:hypothetical protein
MNAHEIIKVVLLRSILLWPYEQILGLAVSNSHVE